MNSNKRCPVCGSEKNSESLSDNTCKNCGFGNAYIRYFAGKKSYLAWLDTVETARTKWKQLKRINFANSNCFCVGKNFIAYCDHSQKKIYIAYGNGMMAIENNAVEISASESNHAVLYADGTVKVFDSVNEYGQNNTNTWNNICHILSTPKCIYGITEEGNVVISGMPANSEISNWINIKSLKSGNIVSDEVFIMGLSENGQVTVSGAKNNEIAFNDVKSWKNIKRIVASRNCLVGLKSDGTVNFLGKEDDSRSLITKWTDIIEISSDNTFVYGLSRNGSILIEGKTKAFLDKGRSSASWDSIIALSCNSVGIGAITESGDLRFKGSISGDLKVICGLWSDNIKPLIAF